MITRKIGKLLRGKATPFQLFAACILGSMIAFVPGFGQAPGLLLTLILCLIILNANLGVAALVGIGAKILFQELKPGIDPLGPENKLIFATGPITGTLIPGNTRFIVMGKSPATGLWGEANCSGSFGRQLG